MELDTNLRKNASKETDVYVVGKKGIIYANKFSDVAEQLYDNVLKNEREIIIPMCVNAAFACELYSKAISRMKKDEIQCNKHGLKDLFEKFPDEEKTKIKEIYGNSFEQDIKEMDQMFIVLRYGYEYEKLAVDYERVIKYMRILRDMLNS